MRLPGRWSSRSTVSAGSSSTTEAPGTTWPVRSTTTPSRSRVAPRVISGGTGGADSAARTNKRNEGQHEDSSCGIWEKWGQGGFGVTERNHNETASQYQDNCTDGLTLARPCLLPPFPPQPPPPSVRPSSFFCLLSSVFCLSLLYPVSHDRPSPVPLDRCRRRGVHFGGARFRPRGRAVRPCGGRPDGVDQASISTAAGPGPGEHPSGPSGPRRSPPFAASARGHPPGRVAAAPVATAGRH